MDMDWNNHSGDREWLEHRKPSISKPYNARLPALDPELWPDFDDYLTSRHLSPLIARANHWYPSRNAGDRLPRVVIPCTSDQPGNLFWQARAIEGEPRYQSPWGCASGDAVAVVYPGAKALISVVVEGPMDALAAADMACLGIALLGATPPPERITLTARLCHGTICYVVADRDAVGPFAEVMSQLSNLGVSCRLVIPPAKDLAALDPRQRVALVALLSA